MMDVMIKEFPLAKLVMLKKRKDFDYVYQKRNVFGNRNLVMYFVKNGTDTNRLGIVVSKKVSNLAVDRNKIRRRLKDIVRLNDGKVKQGYDLLIIAKPNCLDLSYQMLEKAFMHLCYRKHLLKSDGES